ncbi:hypothetical protein A6A03_04460 [Chloroflexus islandicus]|uniref:Uncharacterized protein n=1 Tax=Chloroflexus islandicus TaxID=1707952 RepID=A0A178M1Q6_9CHLR|nr:hypothetical protein [Chloroflexus islandicus]OAN40567.1 hypothetical protein A6A03_04460 [Chloroflexus islandicus]
MNHLSDIAAKAPIVPTFSARSLRDTSAEVRDVYEWHAKTYVEQPALAELRGSFLQAVQEAKTPKACLIAPFGYGKTASAIGLWHACRQAGVLAIPPVSCGSFTELADAIYGWLAFTLPESAQTLAQAYDAFLVSSAESLARHDEREFGIPFAQAVVAIRDKLERGYLDFADVSINLLAFLEQATRVAQSACYNGLVVIIDEFQQLLGNANKGVLTALRQLIWGLRVRKLPFGLVFTMDPDTERTLADRAGDILHRIKDDGLYLDIRHIYDHTFPARLWQQYADTLSLSDAERQVIDWPTLEALGQLCEREDLSNGPRTVINVLQRTAASWDQTFKATYTPINLIDDLLSGQIRFDGDRGIIPALVAELLNFPYFQRSQERSAALKLIAAFPRGCPEQVAARYGLSQAWNELNDDLRGEIITETDEGLALIELQRVGRPANRLNILLRRYWMQITDQQLLAEDAARTFRDIVIPLLFPSKVHDLNGWSSIVDIELTADNTYAGIIEGTSSTSFPLRRIALSVRDANLTSAPSEPADDVDLTLVFAIDLKPESISSLRITDDLKLAIFTMAISKVAQHHFHNSIRWIAHYLSPHPISPAIILSLLRYLRREPIANLPERDRMRIEDAVSRLHEWLLAELFSTSLFTAVTMPVVSAGAGAVKEFLFQLFRKRWPDYQPLARTANWMALMRDYQQALQSLAPAARLGQQPVTGSKSHIAALFGQKRHAGFDSYARQHGDLLRVEKWQGDQAVIRLHPHPMELQIADQVRQHGSCSEQDIYSFLRQAGFAAAEATQLLTLALLRGLIQKDGVQLTVPLAPTPIELANQLQMLKKRAQALGSEVVDRLQALLADFDPDTEHGALVAWRLDQAEQHIVQLEQERRAALQAHRDRLRNTMMRHLPQLSKALPEPPEGPLFNHLAAVRRELVKVQHHLQGPVTAFVTNPTTETPLETIDDFARRLENWLQQANYYEHWVIFASELARLQIALDRIPSTNSKLSTLRQELARLIRQARAIQAEIGMQGLAEIDHLRARLTMLRRQFDELTDERRAAYEQAAAQLRETLMALFDLPASFTLPPYQAANDEESYRILKRTVALTLHRAVLLLELSLSDDHNQPSVQRRQLGSLRKQIRNLATLTRDPDKLFAPETLTIQPELIQRIQKLRERITLQQQLDTTTMKHHAALAAALSDLPVGPSDLSSLLAKLNGAVSRSELLHKLLQLHERGIVRLIIDLPGSGHA